jgi:hypothetical protein
MIAQAGESTLLIDRSKLSARGLTAIAPIADITRVQAVGLSTLEVAALNGLGARVQNLVPEPADD